MRKLRAQWPRAQRIRVVCGAGNNAGDGYVLARLAKTVGLDVRVGWLGDPENLHGDAQTAYAEAWAAGVAMAAHGSMILLGIGMLVFVAGFIKFGCLSH